VLCHSVLQEFGYSIVRLPELLPTLAQILNHWNHFCEVLGLRKKGYKGTFLQNIDYQTHKLLK